MTNIELYKILTDPSEWWKKTKFHRSDGTIIDGNEPNQVKELMEHLPE